MNSNIYDVSDCGQLYRVICETFDEKEGILEFFRMTEDGLETHAVFRKWDNIIFRGVQEK